MAMVDVDGSSDNFCAVISLLILSSSLCQRALMQKLLDYYCFVIVLLVADMHVATHM